MKREGSQRALWGYENPIISSVPAPYLGIVLMDVTKKRKFPGEQGEAKALLDTGYDGHVMIPIKVFEEVGLISSELPQDQLLAAETFSGEKVQLRTAYGNLEIPKLGFAMEVEVDTHHSCTEILVGRKLMEGLIATLIGPKHELEVKLP